MSLLVAASRFPEAVGNVFARLSNWSPLDKAVTILIEISDDPYLAGRTIQGTVRAGDNRTGALLVLLADLLPRRDDDSFVDLVVAAPVLRWHGPNRLLVTWTAVRLIDAASFRIDDARRAIGTGRLLLRR